MIGIQVLLTLVGALLVGGQTAPSVLMGGAVGTAGAVVFVAMASRKTQATSATEVLIGALLAEGAKLLVIALLLWLAVSSYP
ncbi:MAG TPA: hypothetical protein HPQ00_08370, partial [Magnetococcales bacterium]|nr:hypothetical protein [Magnetococcales bacterium]